MKLLIKWTLLVTFSAIAGIIGGLLSEDATLASISGMLFGILTFILIYYGIDKSLIKRKLEPQRKSLVLAVKIKMALQLLPFIDALAGSASLNIVSEFIYERDSELLYIYVTTLATGFVLSWVVGVIFFIIRLVSKNIQASAAHATDQ